MPSTLLRRFGNRLVELRRSQGWSQDQLCERTGISKPHLSNLENGNREACLLTMAKLAEAFSIDLAELLRGVSKH